MEVVRQTQLPVELVIFTLALYVLGGVLTPVFLVYTFSILVSIILLEPAGVYRTAGTAAILYCGLALLENHRLIPYVKGYWGDHDYYEVASTSTYVLYMMAVPSILMVAAYIANRIALLISSRNRQIESQLQDLRTLYDITNGLGSIMDEDKMLRYLATTLKTLQNALFCVITLDRKDKESSSKVRVSSGLSAGGLARLDEIDKSMPDLVALREQGQPLILEDLDKHPEFRAVSPDPNVRSAYVFPIKSEGRVMGNIALAFDRLKPLSQGYSALLTTIASQAGAALQRAQLYSDAERMAREMGALYDIGLHTGSTLSTQEVIRRTAVNIEKLMSPDTYYIALYDADISSLSFEIFIESGQPMPRMVMALTEGGLTGRIIQSRKPLLVQDWLSDGAPYNAIAKRIGADMLSYLGVPMFSEDRVIGVISVQCARPLAFTPHDERLLMALAAQTGMAMENARLHQVAKDQSALDSMTQVYNHGYFVELVRQAIDKADREQTPVSLIMLDIDFFKKYNDQYGHVAGDNVLKLAARALKGHVKSTDSVGRWGGEEFGVLLPGASLADAQKIARRIRRAVASLSPVDGQGTTIPSPTISQGISSYPCPACSGSELIEQADAALYHAKEHGRNQLTICESADALILAPLTAPLQKDQIQA